MTDFGALLRPDVQAYIHLHTGTDPAALALKPNPFPDVDHPSLVQQVTARTKAKDKLPTWFNAADIVYPSRISVEQTSSEATAQYKASLVSGQRLADLTGGFGVDSFFFSQRVATVVHVEKDAYLSAVSAHNFRQLGSAVQCVNRDSTEWLAEAGTFDWLYIDPSRRHDLKGKVFLLKDCLPDVPALLDFYFTHTERILIKTAPLLDISAGLSELHAVTDIHVVAVGNEVKEVLWVLQKNVSGTPRVHAVTLGNPTPSFTFPYGEAVPITYADPLTYLYEPHAAVLKSGGHDRLAVDLSLMKLAPHSHLYTSDTQVPFPGRTFTLRAILPYSKTDMAALKGRKANVTVRNFPETVEVLRKKWKIADGGADYWFFTTDKANRKIVLLCAKIETPL
ncbi:MULTISPECIES: class I SAM-dependent methyltransferase [unclassified Flavobacterium]|uniref:THUMP-like domain-containing protein n=1 Tax=unclassified Flavobacterium TaxID=196869 RepID=UPI001F134AE9|nr:MULTISPECIES: class I SAM-dependent methyltransferase [unclassified Flavobacterium]UMY65072.1 class I SAM-dependent methyltransferase [Flavobacterium sp. HJ-32-4]